MEDMEGGREGETVQLRHTYHRYPEEEVLADLDDHAVVPDRHPDSAGHSLNYLFPFPALN